MQQEKPIAEISLQELRQWLFFREADTTQNRFILENLRALLLDDLYKSLSQNPKPIQYKQFPTAHAHHKSLILPLACVIFFCSEGVDGFFVLLETLSLQAVCILIMGLVFSLISVITLYTLNLIAIGKEFGIKAQHVPAMLDLYLKEVQTIKAIRKQIAGNIIRQETLAELQDDLLIIQLVSRHYEGLDKARNTLTSLINNPTLKIAKYVSATVTGILLFSGGFFAGQTVAIDMATLILGSVNPSSWPIILASFVVGLAALCVYWFIERPDIENTVSRWFGLEQDKTQTFCDYTKVNEQKEKLLRVSKNLQMASQRLTTLKLEDNSRAGKKARGIYSPQLFKLNADNSTQELYHCSQAYQH